MYCTLPKVLVQVHQVQDAGFDLEWGNRKGLKRTSAQHYSHLKMVGRGSKMHMALSFPELVDTTQGASSMNVKCFRQVMSNTLSTPSSYSKFSAYFPTSNTHPQLISWTKPSTVQTLHLQPVNYTHTLLILSHGQCTVACTVAVPVFLHSSTLWEMGDGRVIF